MKNTIDEQKFQRVYDNWIILLTATVVVALMAAIYENHQSHLATPPQQDSIYQFK